MLVKKDWCKRETKTNNKRGSMSKYTMNSLNLPFSSLNHQPNNLNFGGSFNFTLKYIVYKLYTFENKLEALS